MLENPTALLIRELILSGELKPGERLREEALAARLSMSRTPIRNVLPALAREGLIEPWGKRSYAVKAFTRDDSLQALELRGVLEGHAARLMAEASPSEAVLAEMESCLREGDEIFAKRYVTAEDCKAYAAMNQRFHAVVVAATDFSLLTQMIDRVNTVPFVSPATVAFDRSDLDQVYMQLLLAHGQHHAIVDAIRSRNGARADMLFREHTKLQHKTMWGQDEAPSAPSESPRVTRGKR